MKRKISDFRNMAREELLGNYLIPSFSVLSMALFVCCLSSPFYFTVYNVNNVASIVIFYVATFMINIISRLFFIGILYILMQITRHEKTSFANLLYAFTHKPDRFIKAIIFLLLIGIVVGLPLDILDYFSNKISFMNNDFSHIIILFLHMIIRLIIFLLFMPVYLLMIDNQEIKGMEAVKKSFFLMKGHRKNLFLLVMSFFGWLLLGIISFGFAFLWVTPYFFTSVIYYYYYITNQIPESETYKEYYV
ncbi:Uncharacterized membrane protein [Acetitomaculum ruminis DSM 5522]|uniref:Uncharacterized membrane protein n=1 Tax=Acetitomaculum ruminis DSM 5522 TaxID=1120918 RepID=A0A1I0W4P5_9FIRM|nr:DUF975 family protein [Acetitomaculum ruminis]SFA83043.1 Uncharacterized membrane protein [Acetitomaculum ruminis DSM 5522]